MLTSSGDSDEAKAARKAGLSAYLTKPVRRERLHQCLATILTPDVQSEHLLVTEEIPRCRGGLTVHPGRPVLAKRAASARAPRI